MFKSISNEFDKEGLALNLLQDSEDYTDKHTMDGTQPAIEIDDSLLGLSEKGSFSRKNRGSYFHSNRFENRPSEIVNPSKSTPDKPPNFGNQSVDIFD
jgi:hypothetical protein